MLKRIRADSMAFSTKSSHGSLVDSLSELTNSQVGESSVWDGLGFSPGELLNEAGGAIVTVGALGSPSVFLCTAIS